MRRIGRLLLRILVIFVAVALAVGLYMREEIQRLWTVNTLFDAENIVENFSHMDDAFLTVEVPRGPGPASPLPEGTPADLPEEVASWIEERSVTSLLVLHEGQVVHESYHLGTAPDDRRISWSVAKSFLSALMGSLVDDGTIPDLDVPVTDYVPSLAGTAYDGATIRDVLQMSSGVTFDEDYLDYHSDINRMGRVVALGRALDDFTAGLTETDGPAGEEWQYVSIDTHVIGMVIRGATGRDIPSLLSERIIAPLGMESALYYITDGEGVAFVLGGLNMTTRDYARLGMMFLRDGAWNGQQILSTQWVTEFDNRLGQYRSGRDWLRLPVVDSRGRRARPVHGPWNLRPIRLCGSGERRRDRDDRRRPPVPRPRRERRQRADLPANCGKPVDRLQDGNTR